MKYARQVGSFVVHKKHMDHRVVTTVPLWCGARVQGERVAPVLVNVHGYLPLPLELMIVFSNLFCDHGNHRNHTEGNDTGADFAEFISTPLQKQRAKINEVKMCWSNTSIKV